MQVAWVSLCVKQGCHLPPVLCLRCHGEKQVTPAEPFANLHGLDECSELPDSSLGCLYLKASSERCRQLVPARLQTPWTESRVASRGRCRA